VRVLTTQVPPEEEEKKKKEREREREREKRKEEERGRKGRKEGREDNARAAVICVRVVRFAAERRSTSREG